MEIYTFTVPAILRVHSIADHIARSRLREEVAFSDGPGGRAGVAVVLVELDHEQAVVAALLDGMGDVREVGLALAQGQEQERIPAEATGTGGSRERVSTPSLMQFAFGVVHLSVRSFGAGGGCDTDNSVAST